MRTPWYGNSDDSVREHGYIFDQTANLYSSTVGITPAQLTALDDAYFQYESAIQFHLTQVEAAKSARAAKDLAKATLIRQLQTLGAKVKASSAATPSLILEFGMKPNAKPTKTAPKVPTELRATGSSDGTNSLRWMANGNKERTVYVIEANIGGDGAWQSIGAVTATRFDHEGQTPGQFVLYRVAANRRGLQSAFSESASVYGAQAARAA